MNKNLTELVFIIDRSGSMNGLESDTIGGFNSLLEKQKKEKGDAIITTVLFDDEYELLHDRISINGVRPITSEEYYVRGTTALFDAIGKTLSKITNAHKNTIESERPGKVIFVITTDGLENASIEYRSEQIKKMIEKVKDEHGFEFLFLGANIDAIQQAGDFGIDSSRAANFCSDSEGTRINYACMSRAISSFREDEEIADNWKEKITGYFKKKNT